MVARSKNVSPRFFQTFFQCRPADASAGQVIPDCRQDIITAGLPNLVAVAAGAYHTLALKSGGSRPAYSVLMPAAVCCGATLLLILVALAFGKGRESRMNLWRSRRGQLQSEKALGFAEIVRERTRRTRHRLVRTTKICGTDELAGARP